MIQFKCMSSSSLSSLTIWRLSVLLIGFINFVDAAPFNFLPNDPEFGGSITTRVIALNSTDQENVLRQFNISVDTLKMRMNREMASTLANEPTQPESDKKVSEIKELRLQDVRNKIENALNGNTMMMNNLPTHEMAAYPICNQNEEITWKQFNNITIKFSSTLFETRHTNIYLDTAVLRLYKIQPQLLQEPMHLNGNERVRRCNENPIDTQIRVTISTMQNGKRNRKEKKRICNTMMLDYSHTGWVEIDIKKAINTWEKATVQNDNVVIGSLNLEVHDEEENPLKPGEYFESPKCSEASVAIPWNFYRQHLSWSESSMETVPHAPRIDVKFIDFKNYPYHNPRQVHHSNNHHQNHRVSGYRHPFINNGNTVNSNNNDHNSNSSGSRILNSSSSSSSENNSSVGGGAAIISSSSSTSPAVIIHTTGIEHLAGSAEIHRHRKRHEQNHRRRWRHQSSEHSQDASSENSNPDD